MSETIVAPREREDRVLPAVTYVLYLAGLANGLTLLIGLFIAYANRGTASLKMQSHYTFLIRTFWVGLAWMGIAAGLVLFGIPLSLVLIGIPMMIAGGVIFSLGWVWLLARTLVGGYYLLKDEAYPRPQSWII